MSRNPLRRSLELNQGVTNSDDTPDDDVRVYSGPVGEILDDPRSRHLLKMPTWLAEFHAKALDLTDAEALAYKSVDVHTTHGHLPPSLARLESDLLDNLGCNERQRLARTSAAGVEVPVSFQPFSGDSLRRIDGPKFGLAWSPQMDRLHRHCTIMHDSQVAATPEHSPS